MLVTKNRSLFRLNKKNVYSKVGRLGYMKLWTHEGAEGFLEELGERGLKHVLTLEDINVHETVCVHYDYENNPKSIYIDDYEKFQDFCEKLHEVRFYVNDPNVPEPLNHNQAEE